MNYIGRVLSNVREFYNEINSATLTGAIDVVVVEQQNGSYLCSPFHVRFGKMGVLRSKEKIVDIEINGEAVDIHMKLGDSGEAFFIEEIDDEELTLPNYLATSPLDNHSNADHMLDQLNKLKIESESITNDSINNEIVIKVEADDTSKCDSNAEQMIENKCDTNEANELCNTSLLNHQNSIKSSSLPNSYVVPNLIEERRRSLTPPNSPLMSAKVYSPFRGDYDRKTSMATQTETNTDCVPNETHSINISNTSPINLPQKRLRRKKKSSAVKRQLKMRSKENEDFANNEENIFQMDDDISDDNQCDRFSSSVPILDDISSNKQNTPHSTSFHDLYPYSDSELTPTTINMNPKYGAQTSRPSTPDYKSDSEYEIQKHDAMSQTDSLQKVSWQWGELPRVPRKTSDDINVKTSVSPLDKADDIASSDDENDLRSAQNAKNSMLGGVLNFMKHNKNMKTGDKDLTKDGIYLDDLNPNDIDPEVAALYFPKFRSNYPLKRVTDDDTESGNGPSLPHSPNSLDVCISSGPQSIDSGDSDQERSSLCTSYDLYSISKAYHDLSMSVCGGLEDLNKDGLSNERFLHSIISFDDFSENPTAVLQNPNLVIRMGGKFYNWSTAAPIIISLIMFQRQIPDKTLDSLHQQYMPKKEEKKQFQASKSSWWSWRRSNTVSEGQNKDRQAKTQSPVDDQSLMTNSSSSGTLVNSESFGEKINEANGLIKPIINEDANYISSGSEAEDSVTPVSDGKYLSVNGSVKRSRAKYRKKLRLSSDEIKNLNLHDGSNEVMFSVTTAYQGTTTCKCHIYLWRFDDKIIISDIDGTITKSDVLGHILPIIGRDWAQSGVANLFNKIQQNGYKFLYLSARAIGQARITREYLKSIRQGEICLPDGPLLLSPTSLISALHREVIEKKPEEFKISCLKDIQSLFPDKSPFYAGFGNKINDTWAYRAVDIHLSRIFTINHRGELKLELIQTFQSTYTRLSDVVDHMFPTVRVDRENTYNSEFSSFEYWRAILPELNDEELASIIVNTPKSDVKKETSKALK